MARVVGSVQASKSRGSSHLQDFHLGLVEHVGLVRRVLGAEVLVLEAEVHAVGVLVLGQHQRQVLPRGRRQMVLSGLPQRSLVPSGVPLESQRLEHFLTQRLELCQKAVLVDLQHL